MNIQEIRKAFETFFEVPDFLQFDGEDYVYYEDDPILKEQVQDIQSKWSGFQSGIDYMIEVNKK